MAHLFTIDGLPVETGDLICTQDGGDSIVAGQFWRLIGKLIPGEVDHIVVYVGPAGRCVEAGARARVIEFDIGSGTWDAARMMDQRLIDDRLVGVADPLQGRGFSRAEEERIRMAVADYCLAQAARNAPYNLNFFDSATENGFYCSQLAYKAYLPHGVDLNSGKGVPDVPGTERIVFPQEVWESCTHRRPG
mgnify:CR=1 FL=1